MRNRTLSLSLILVAFSAMSHAQSNAVPIAKPTFASRTEVAATYTYVRSTTTTAAGGGGFSLSGASLNGSYALRHRLSAVAEFGGTHINGITNTGLSLTMLTYFAGVRYTLAPIHRFRPFAQGLFGGVHAYGSLYPANSATTGGADTFAMTLGGGADYLWKPHIYLRGEAGYLQTDLPNAINNRQEDLRLDGGLVVHFGR